MLRVMFVTGSLAHGGAERHAITLMNRLAQRGHECHTVYIKEAAAQLDRIRVRDGGSVRCLGATRYLDPRALIGFAGHLSRMGPSVIVAANAYALMYSWLALHLSQLRAPLVATYHSMRLLSAKERLQMLVYRPFFWTADCLVFVSEKQRRHWLRRAVLSRRTEVIHKGVDTDEFCGRWNGECREKIRGGLGLTSADYVIGIPAVLRAEKNHVQLVEAVAMLRAAGIPARALMIGDGEMRGMVEARARELRVEGDVVITGFQQEVRPYIAACDVVALCSLTETFSMAAIEAMAMGKPVVHADVGGAAEMIFPGQNGFLFPVGDTDALADKLAILSDRVLSMNMGLNARRVAETFFSENTMVDRYEQALLEVCGLRSPAGEAVMR